MKQIHFQFLLTLVLLSMFGAKGYGKSYEYKNNDGIVFLFRYINDDKELELIKVSRVKGYVGIPSELTIENNVFKVTSIDGAFYLCSSLTSVSIPRSWRLWPDHTATRLKRAS